jgi:hypothetical protein
MALKLTFEEIEAGKTERGGWAKSTIEGWGIAWPPPKGWKEALMTGEKIGFAPQTEPESAPDSIEASVLHDVMMAVISADQGDILKEVDSLNAMYGGKLPTVADIVGERPETAIIEGGITWEDKVYRFSVARRVK